MIKVGFKIILLLKNFINKIVLDRNSEVLLS